MKYPSILGGNILAAEKNSKSTYDDVMPADILNEKASMFKQH